MKALFLDIDGVLNSHRSAVAFGGMPFDARAHRHRFDEIAVRLIGGIAETAGAKIVLSSSWRNDVNWQQIGPALGLPIMDRTPSMLGPRGKEIAAWLASHSEVERYAIVDDDGDMLPEQMPYFVHTDMREGFTWACAEKLAELLDIRIFDVNRGRPLPAEGRTLKWDDDTSGVLACTNCGTTDGWHHISCAHWRPTVGMKARDEPLWFLRVRKHTGEWGTWTQTDVATVEDFRKNVTMPIYEAQQFLPYGVGGSVTLTPDGEAVVPGVGVEFAMQCLARADALLQGIADQDVVVHSAAHELHHALEVLRRAHGVMASDGGRDA